MVKILTILWAGLFMVGVNATEVEFKTSAGNIIIKVDEKNAPITAENFLRYVKDGFYDGLIFHRVIKGFVVQGGGFTSDMQLRETREPIAIESDNGLKNLHYSLSMARTQDPNSATSQFFINLTDNAFLDKSAKSEGYAVFGDVIVGKEVIDKIAQVKTANVGPYADVPVDAITITEAKIKR